MNKKLAVLIPAYKREFIKSTLMSALNQTHIPDLIAISDDSPGNIVTEDLKKFIKENNLPARKINFLEGPKNGGMANITYLIKNFENSGHGLLHLLFDDDVISNTFYEAHQWILETDTESKLSISKRSVIDKNNNQITKFPYPLSIRKESKSKISLSAEFLYKSTTPKNINWLGEFSNCVFRSEVASKICRSENKNIPYYGLNDIGFFLQMSEIHPISFVNHYLGSFRISPESNSSNKDRSIFKTGVSAWLAIAIPAWSSELISDSDLSACASRVMKNYLSFYGPDSGELMKATRAVAELMPDSPEKFIAAWFESLESFPEGRQYLQYIDAD